MLSRSQRLSGEQFDEVMKKGRVTNSSFFWVRFLKNEEKTKIAAIVPQKTVKTAVGRNSLRRKIYRFTAEFFDSIKPGFIIICAKEQVVSSSDEVISKELRDIFVKASLLK